MLINIRNKLICILAHTEEICFLLGVHARAAAVRAAAVLELQFRPEGFAGRAVPALVFRLVDVALIVKLLENFLYTFLMVLICCADKIVI